MKIVDTIKQILSITLFLSGVTSYLFLASSSPLLHNHPVCVDSEHQYDHHDDHREHNPGDRHPYCPACRFLDTASFSTVPEAVIISTILDQLAYQIFFNNQQPYKQTFHKSYSARGPPVVSA